MRNRYELFMDNGMRLEVATEQDIRLLTGRWVRMDVTRTPDDTPCGPMMIRVDAITAYREVARMVTMSELKAEMAEMQRIFEKDSEYYHKGDSLAIEIEFRESDGGLSKFIRDRADNWYIAGTDLYTDSSIGYIYLARYSNADGGA